ncbi:MAG: amidohydrolase family protein [Acidimicrobiia bacterium]
MKIWANSGDSHFLEPMDLFRDSLPADLAERLPRSEKDETAGTETVYVDGQQFTRKMPSVTRANFLGSFPKPPGNSDARLRLNDLDGEGVWAEVVYPSMGLWNGMIRDPRLAREAARVANDWVISEIHGVSRRLLPTAEVSLLDMDDAAAEIRRVASKGLRGVFLPTKPPASVDLYNRDSWEPVWQAAEEAEMVICFHIGTDSVDPTTQDAQVMFRGPGGAIMNYVETTYGGQRAVTQMVTSGALDRHPNLKVLVSEGGASWVPFLGDRMNEAYRQHGAAVRPKLSMLPKEILYRQVYTSFQHDVSAINSLMADGYQNVMWGSDYPHLEGTFGHTQDTLHELFDGKPDWVRERITRGAFEELFPGVPAMAAA